LLGDWGGVRGALRDRGLTFDVFSTNFFADVANGGLTEQAKFRGRTDYLVNVNGEKAGLWKGSFIDLHAETIYGDSINNATGAFMPSSIGELLPTPKDSTTALTAVKVTQALSERLMVFGGKLNLADGFNQPFAGDALGRNGFWNGGMVLPPVLVRTVPYSTFGAGFAYLRGAEPVFTFLVLDTNNTPTRSGFDTFFNNGVVFVPSVNVPTKFFGLPGHQGLTAAFSTGRYAIIDRAAFINAIVFGQPVPQKSGSWALNYAFDQALHVDPADPKRSWGVFGNLGLADENPSPFRWSANVGVGGSSPLPGRKLDTFGVGYYYLGLNNALQNVAPRLFPLRDHEQGVELFYNCAVTPWCHLTPDMQVVIPSQKRADSVLFFGIRAKIDF
jgi:porin